MAALESSVFCFARPVKPILLALEARDGTVSDLSRVGGYRSSEDALRAMTDLRKLVGFFCSSDGFESVCGGSVFKPTTAFKKLVGFLAGKTGVGISSYNGYAFFSGD